MIIIVFILCRTIVRAVCMRAAVRRGTCAGRLKKGFEVTNEN